MLFILVQYFLGYTCQVDNKLTFLHNNPETINYRSYLPAVSLFGDKTFEVRVNADRWQHSNLQALCEGQIEQRGGPSSFCFPKSFQLPLGLSISSSCVVCVFFSGKCFHFIFFFFQF